MAASERGLPLHVRRASGRGQDQVRPLGDCGRTRRHHRRARLLWVARAETVPRDRLRRCQWAGPHAEGPKAVPRDRFRQTGWRRERVGQAVAECDPAEPIPRAGQPIPARRLVLRSAGAATLRKYSRVGQLVVPGRLLELEGGGGVDAGLELDGVARWSRGSSAATPIAPSRAAKPSRLLSRLATSGPVRVPGAQQGRYRSHLYVDTPGRRC